MTVVSLAFLLCLGMAQAPGTPASCDVVASGLSNELAASNMAMEPGSRRQAIYDRAETVPRCADSEELAYGAYAPRNFYPTGPGSMTRG